MFLGSKYQIMLALTAEYFFYLQTYKKKKKKKKTFVLSHVLNFQVQIL